MIGALLAALVAGATAVAATAAAEVGGNSSPVCAADEAIAATQLMFVFLVLIVSLLGVYLLVSRHWHYLPESVATIAVGVVIGLLVRWGEFQPQMTATQLHPETFFLFILPAIIFESGYSLEKGDFFGQIGGIILFAVVGTVISTFVVALGLYLVGMTPLSPSLSLLDCLLFGALISAVDPVATLAIFSSLNVNPQLYMLVFGESVVNDAVSIVLYRTFEGFAGTNADAKSDFSGMSVVAAIGQFLYVSIGSTAVGVIASLLVALFFKYVKLREHVILEFGVFVSMCYVPYLFCESVHLSGIMCVLAEGIVMSYYVRPNLSETIGRMSNTIFKIFAFVGETLVFVYLGFAVAAFDHELNFGLIVFGIIFCVLGRAGNIFPLSWILNRGRKIKISRKNQFVMFFSGLRGAIAFALSLSFIAGSESSVPVSQGRMLFSTTLAIVLFTIVGFGGSTLPLMRILKIDPKTSLAKADQYRDVASADEYWRLITADREKHSKNLLVRLDEQYLRNFFCRADALPPQRLVEARELALMDSRWFGLGTDTAVSADAASDEGQVRAGAETGYSGSVQTENDQREEREDAPLRQRSSSSDSGVHRDAADAPDADTSILVDPEACHATHWVPGTPDRPVPRSLSSSLANKMDEVHDILSKMEGDDAYAQKLTDAVDLFYRIRRSR